MEEHDRVMVEIAASTSRYLHGIPKINVRATGPKNIPLDVIEDLNMIDVLLSCHSLFEGTSVIKLAKFNQILCLQHVPC